MIAIVGESGSGKSTLQRMLVKYDPEKYERVVTYTTRPSRANETDGMDYHFISDDDFAAREAVGFFVESNSYRGWKYGTARDTVEKQNPCPVAVITPAGLRDLRRNGISVNAIYICIDRESRLKKQIDRGDNVDEAYRRNLSDVGQFDGIEREVDYVIHNEGYSKDKNEILAELIQYLRG